MTGKRLPLRTDKFLRDARTWSRRAAEKAVAAGRIAVSEAGVGEPAVVVHADQLVMPDDAVFIDGEKVAAASGFHTFVFHKPAGVVTTLSDPSGRRCVADFLGELPTGLFPVGRLDAETTGLLLLSDDGDLAHLLLHPRHHADKEYHLVVTGHVAAEDPRVVALLTGIELDDGPARALEVGVMFAAADVSRLSVVVGEGRNRMVRRMAKKVGLDLRALHRHRLGALTLGDLPVGDIRPLMDDELAALWAPFGGRAAVEIAQVKALRARAERFRSEGRPHARLEAWLETDGWRWSP